MTVDFSSDDIVADFSDDPVKPEDTGVLGIIKRSRKPKTPKGTVDKNGFPRVTPETQLARDKKRVEIIEAEAAAATDPRDIKSLNRELHGGMVTTHPKAAGFGAKEESVTRRTPGVIAELKEDTEALAKTKPAPDFSSDEIVKAPDFSGDLSLSEIAEKNKTTDLFSKEGAEAIGKSVGPALNIGIEGAKQIGIESAQQPFKPIKPIDPRNVELTKLDGTSPALPKGTGKGINEILETDTPLHPDFGSDALAESHKSTQESQQALQEAMPENPSFPLEIGISATQSFVASTPGLIASLITRNPAFALGGGGLLELGRTFADKRTPDRLTGEVKAEFEAAFLNATMNGTIEAGLELIPVNYLIKHFGDKNVYKTIGKFILREEATEIPTTILQKIADRVTTEGDKPLGEFTEELWHEVVLTAASTPFAAGGSAGFASLATKPFRRREEKKLEKLKEMLEGVGRTQAEFDAKVAAGLNPEDQTVPQHQDVPDRPLTAEEESLAQVQLRNIQEGANAVPENPAAIPVAEGVSKALQDPVFAPTTESKQAADDQIQSDIDNGQTRAAAESRARQVYPNQLPADQRPIAYSTTPEQIGLSLRQTELQPDSVVVLQGNEDQFSPAYTQALGVTINSWQKQFMPAGSKIVVNLSGLKGAAVGAYSSANGVHIISPRAIVAALRAETETAEGTTLGAQSGLAGYNTFTQQQTLGAIHHEFGHALTMAAFDQNMPVLPGIKSVVGHLDSNGRFDEAQLTQMPQEQAAVIREFQARKDAVLNGTMSARELLETWLGVWKVGKDIAKTKNRQILERYALDTMQKEANLTGKRPLANRNLDDVTALELVHAMGRNKDVSTQQSNAEAEKYYLQFNEYMAEQFSRYAHGKKIDEGTPLGTYFKATLARLREFFKSLKTSKGVDGTAIIKPGTKFAEWVDSLQERNRAIETAKVAQKRKVAKIKRPRKITAKPKAKPKSKTVTTPDDEFIERVINSNDSAIEEGQTVSEVQELAEDPFAKAALKLRIQQSLPDPKDPARAELMALVGKGQLMQAEEQLVDIISEQTRKDVKAMGGAWSPSSVRTFVQLIRSYPMFDHANPGNDAILKDWYQKTGKRYLNKHAGTKNDPLKDFEVPFRGGGRITWGELMDKIIVAEKSENYQVEFPKAPPNTDIWKVTPSQYAEDGAYISSYTSDEYVAFINYTRHISDYLAHNVEVKDLQKYDFVRAFSEVQKIDIARAKKMETTEGKLEGTVPIKVYPEGFQWVEVQSEEALKNEGDAMGHCVGDYCGVVERGEATIYSLRDAKGAPHVTVEIRPSEVSRTPQEVAQGLPAADDIVQIRGKQNLAPNEEYIPYAQDLVRTGRWGSVSQLEEIDMVDIRSGYLGVEDRMGEWQEAIKQQTGSDSPFQIWSEIAPLHQQFAVPVDSTEDFEGPYFDKGSEDADEIQQNMKRIGDGKLSVSYQRAVNFIKDSSHYIQQMQQLAHSTQDTGATQFVNAQNRLQAMKNSLLEKGKLVAEEWETMTRDETKKFEKLIMAEFHSGGHVTELVQDELGKWTHRPGAGLMDFMKQQGIQPLSAEGQKLARLMVGMKNSILEHIQTIENGSIAQIKSQFRKAPLVVQQRAAVVREAAKKWRDTPFVPQSHFGKYVVKVYEINSENKRVLARKQHFENAAEQDAAVAKLQRTTKPENLRYHKLADTIQQQLSLPLDFLETLRDTGEFTDASLNRIAQAMQPLRSEKTFTKLERDAEHILGASEDLLKNYANWMEDSANFTAKWIFSRQMTAARAMTRSRLTTERNRGDIAAARDLQRLLDSMSRAQDLIMHPLAEFYKTRSAVALTFLMWAPKTALMNLTGMIQTYAALTADYGEFQGNKLFAGAITGAAHLSSLTENEQQALSQALTDGIIDQGFGYFMSGLANAGNLARRTRTTLVGKGARNFVDAGMYAFKAVETANRRVTLLGFYRAELGIALKQGMPNALAHQQAYRIAAQRTRLLQNDYSAGNRPPILTGYKSIAMIFLSYPQYMLWIMGGGYERGTRQIARDAGRNPRSMWGGTTMRMWLIFLAMAGVEGVPFGEAAIDLMQLMWKKFGTGENVRVEAQRFLKETAGIESMYWRNVIERGLLHNIGGVDLSGSYSLGTPIPGLGMINPHARTWREFVGEAFEEFTGPFGGATKGFLGLGLEDEEIGFKELGQNLPAAPGSIARAVDIANNGLTTRQGQRILRDESGEFRDPTAGEIALTAAGFRLTEVAQFQRTASLKRQQADYWTARRLQVKNQFKENYLDPDLRKDMQSAIMDYNNEVPFTGMRINGAELARFIRQDRRRIQKLEAGRETRFLRQSAEDIDKVQSEGN